MIAWALWLALAQAVPAAKPSPPLPPPPQVAAPYEADMLRLAEVLGSLAYLRDLCDGGDGGRFRERMAALIEADPGAQSVREQMAGAFNRGFESYRQSYRVCTANARETIDAYLAETERLANDLVTRYRGG